eukprot:g2212.t1
MKRQCSVFLAAVCLAVLLSGAVVKATGVGVHGKLEERASAGVGEKASESRGMFTQALQKKRPLSLRQMGILKASIQRKTKKASVKPAEQTLCNGQDICSRKYGDVTFPATHNSYAVDCMGDEGTDYVDHCHWANMAAAAGSLNILDVTTNHGQGLRRQWKAGIRAFLVDTYEVGPGKDTISKFKARIGLSQQKSAIKLCHADCALGQVDAIKWFKELKRLMSGSPNDIVTLWIEDGKVKRSQTREVLRKAGFVKWFDVHNEAKAKPAKSIRDQTLIDLVDGGNQLVVAFQSGKGAQQNSWILRDQVDLHKVSRCKLGGGSISPKNLYVMNQFMSIHAGTPSRDMSVLANMKANIHKRLCMCKGYTQVRPSIVTVDHFQVGDVVGGAKAFNEKGCPHGLKWDGWKDGTMCALGTTCHRCKNKASYWGISRGFPMTKCGDGRLKAGECERTMFYRTCSSHSECRPKKSNPCKGNCVCDKAGINECECVSPVSSARSPVMIAAEKPAQKTTASTGMLRKVRNGAANLATKARGAATSMKRRLVGLFRL